MILAVVTVRRVFISPDVAMRSMAPDVSETAVDFAREYVEHEGQHGTFMVQDVEHLQLEDKFFDVVISYGVLDHVPADKALTITKEVVGPGGMFWLSLASVSSSLFAKGKRTAYHTYLLEKAV